MDEQDRYSGWFSILAHMQLNACCAMYGVNLHLVLFRIKEREIHNVIFGDLNNRLDVHASVEPGNHSRAGTH
jgi:hypothetical protein